MLYISNELQTVTPTTVFSGCLTKLHQDLRDNIGLNRNE